MKRKVIFLTNKIDGHTDVLIDKIGLDRVVRINTDDFLSNQGDEITMASNGISINNITINSCSDHNFSGYFRRPELPSYISLIQDPLEKKIVSSETKSFLRQFYHSCPNVKWLNNPKVLLTTEGKTSQMLLATKAGLKVPNFLITTSINKYQNFLEKHKKIVIKQISPNFSYLQGQDYNIFYTETIDLNSNKKLDLKLLGNCPTFFQQYIKPLYELRITYVSGEFFVARIDANITDWRKDYDNLTYSIETLPNSIKQRIIKFMESMNLNFGCLDFIYDGVDYYFLEVNKNGQWLWIEEVLDLPISDSIVKYLLS